MPLVAKVAVSAAAYHFDKLYSYTITPEQLPFAGPGSLVLVPFGKGRAQRTGVILAVEEDETAGLKNIADIAKEDVKLTGEYLKLIQYLKETTFCTYYDAVKAVLPYGTLYEAVGGKLKKQLPGAEETVFTYEETGAQLTQKQKAVSLFLQAAGQGCTFKDISAAVGAGKSVVSGLVAKGGATAAKRWRGSALPVGNLQAGVLNGNNTNTEKVNLSEQQEAVFKYLFELQKEKKGETALLHGVTGSGKTLVFLKLVQAVVHRGQKALVLVPEISLTPQMVRRFKAVFGARVAVQHSALNQSERLAQWQQIANGGADVVVATRSGVFAPLSNIGAIIIDEEQERAYTSEQSPRYNAIEVAKYRAAVHGALVVLASATPAVESYYAAKSGRYKLLTLNQRYANLPLPTAELVDMADEAKAGNPGQVSRKLAGEIAYNLENGQQSILLLNRRGYNRVAVCADCKESVKCNFCSVPMVHHKSENKLMCHYCGSTKTPPPKVCPSCGGALRYTGAGTQKVEEELAQLFPTARLLRMDTDAVQKKNAREEMLAAFAAKEYDILIGTQMVAKGLDFAAVTLVGVLGIDSLLFSQNYRAYERVFSLITQVVGRGGRAGLPGRAIIQTNDLGNHILHLAARQNYEQFYEEEIAFRRMNLYPPFCAICTVGITGTGEEFTFRAANKFINLISEEFKKTPGEPLRALGPAPYAVAMVGGRHRWRVTLKCRQSVGFRNGLNTVLAAFAKEKEFAGATVTIDFNFEDI